MSNPVLYIEDGPDDVFFMQRALKKVAPEVELRVITNGQEAVDYFDPIKQAESSPVSLSLVILDLNLPGRNGIEVLTQIRAKSDFKTVPVVLFSASDLQGDIESCYAAGCNGYVVKPSNPEQLNTLVLRLADYWLKENRYFISISDVV